MGQLCCFFSRSRYEEIRNTHLPYQVNVSPEACIPKESATDAAERVLLRICSGHSNDTGKKYDLNDLVGHDLVFVGTINANGHNSVFHFKDGTMYEARYSGMEAYAIKLFFGLPVTQEDHDDALIDNLSDFDDAKYCEIIRDHTGVSRQNYCTYWRNIIWPRDRYATKEEQDCYYDRIYGWTMGRREHRGAILQYILNHDPRRYTNPIKSFTVDILSSNEDCREVKFTFDDGTIIYSHVFLPKEFTCWEEYDAYLELKKKFARSLPL
jgi:hypothetical protein